MRRSSKSSLSFRFPNQKPIYKHFLPHTCYMSRPPYCSRFDYPNNIWRTVQITKLLIKQSFQFPCHLFLLRPKTYFAAPYSRTTSACVLS
jgi:hypothetical protein